MDSIARFTTNSEWKDITRECRVGSFPNQIVRKELQGYLWIIDGDGRNICYGKPDIEIRLIDNNIKVFRKVAT